MNDASTYIFDGWALDPRKRRLTRNGEEIVLPERTFAVLVALVCRAPNILTKAELMDEAWPDVVVVEDNLVQAIHTIRTTLGGDSRRPRFVQTVHRKGYRFVAPVEIRSADDSEPPSTDCRGSTTKRRRLRFAAAAGLLVVIAIAARWFGLAEMANRRSPSSVRSIAVLPMENLSGDPEQEYFADGMTDALITELARIQSLDVISRTSVMKFKGTRESVPKIARALGVDAVVEGTVTRSDGRVRIIAQLIDSGDRHLWGENYEEDLHDILRLQHNVACAIAGEINARVSSDEETSREPDSRIDPEALEAYLRGRQVCRDRTEEGIRRAIGYFERSISFDPTYAQAHAGLADAYNLLANYGFEPSTEARPLARRAAEKALDLAPDLVEARVALAVVKGEFEWDFEAAEIEFLRSLALSPSSVIAHSRRAQLLVTRGRFDEAVEEIRRAHRLDPLSDIITANLGWFLFFDGRAEEAENQLREVLDFNPSFAVAHFYLGVILDSQGRFDEAIPTLKRACDLTGSASYAQAALVHALARSGDETAARREMERLLDTLDGAYVSPVGLAVAHFGLGEEEEAFRRLEQAYDERKGWLLHLRAEPALADFRDDPRYLNLVDRIGLP